MKKSAFLILAAQALVQSAALASPTTYVGELRQNSPGAFEIMIGDNTVPLKFSESTTAEVQSLLKKTPFVEIKDGVLQNGVLQSSQVPTIVSGNQTLEGVLTRTRDANETYELSGLKVEFGRTKKITGTEFDGKSREYFSGKQVRAVGIMKNGVFLIESIIRSDVFSADPTPLIDAGLPESFVKSFDENPVGFATALVKGTTKSPSPLWFRKSLFSTGSGAIAVGTPVLLISASGAQGDSAGSVNGHMAAGLGYVGSDQKIRGEMFNVYVTNSKEIVPGNVDMNDYFGQLISGQLNYRPTYTLALYGISEEKILKLKAELDRFHPLFREGHTKITSNKNCATLSVQALADIQVYGKHRNSANGTGEFKLLSKQTGFPPEMNYVEQAIYLQKTKRAEFMPGPAFLSILENLKYLNEHEHLGITRADFIFGGQTPSARDVGGAPTKSIVDQFKDQGVLGAGILTKKVTGKLIKK